VLLEKWLEVNKDCLLSIKMVVVEVKHGGTERDHDDDGIEIPFRRFC
jgi:hypothetical protein